MSRTDTPRKELPVIPQSIATHDNTMLESHARCPTLYYIRHVLGLSRKREEAGPLEFGGLIHDGLAAYYQALFDGKDWRDALMDALQIMATQPYNDPVHGHRSRGRALITMEQYAEHWKNDELIQLLVTETPFDLEDENGFRYGGRLDLGVEFRSSPWPIDHKTSSYFGDTYFDQFKLSPQMAGYIWAEGKLAGKLPQGVIINNLTIRKNGSIEFHRQPILYHANHIEQWYEDTIQRYWKIYRDLQSGIYERRWYNCINQWGRCEAYDVCHGLPENFERNLEVYFEHDPWHWTKENESDKG